MRQPQSVWALPVALAAATGVAGLVLLLELVAPPRPAPTPEPGVISSGDVSLQIQTTSWITHDAVGGPVPASVENGFQMPASMMPGMPDHGTHRLYVEAEISNVGRAGSGFAPGEFAAIANGRTWPLNQPATFAPGVLQPGQERSLDLLFDVPEAVVPADLRWTHDGLSQTVSILSRPPPPHIH